MCALLPVVSEMSLSDHIGLYFKRGFDHLEREVLHDMAAKTYKLVISIIREGELAETLIYSSMVVVESDKDLFCSLKENAKELLESEEKSPSDDYWGTIALRFLANAESENEHFCQLNILSHRFQHAKDTLAILRTGSLKLISQVANDLKDCTDSVRIRDLSLYLTCVDRKNRERER